MWRVQLSHFSASMLAVQVSWSCFLPLNLNAGHLPFCPRLCPCTSCHSSRKHQSRQARSIQTACCSSASSCPPPAQGFDLGLACWWITRGNHAKACPAAWRQAGWVTVGRPDRHLDSWWVNGSKIQLTPLNRIPSKEAAFGSKQFSRHSQWLSPRFGQIWFSLDFLVQVPTVSCIPGGRLSTTTFRSEISK